MTVTGWAEVGQVAVAQATDRTRGCARPIRLRGRTSTIDPTTGAVLASYGSADELDGYTYRRCGDRRAARCPSCSHEYKGDAWHLLVCGMAGGKTVPESVASHPATFVTLTAPSFGPVHGVRDRGPCRPRRDHPVCEHGRPAWCATRHDKGDPVLGQPLCHDCYDYSTHVLWQWHAPELWRRFTIALRRALAAETGTTPAGLREVARPAFVKVTEFQARGIIHAHAVVRLDGPTGPDTPPPEQLTVELLNAAVSAAAAAVSLAVDDPATGGRVRLRFGVQTHLRTITAAADRDATGGRAHPEQVGAYMGKYLTKSTDEFGLPARVPTVAHAQDAGANPHACRIVEAAEQLHQRGGEPYQRLGACYATLGYRGHPVTKSRAYSTTFTALRRARAEYRRRPPRLDPHAPVRDLLDPEQDDLDDTATVVVVREWSYAGRGYLTLDQAAQAVRSAVHARTRAAAATCEPDHPDEYEHDE